MAVEEMVGIALPGVRVNGQSYFGFRDRYETALGDLLLAIFTPIGGRPMRRAFGSGLYRIVFEPVLSEQMVRYVVQDTAEQYVPQLVVDDVLSFRIDRVFRMKIICHLVSDETRRSHDVEVNLNGLPSIGA